MKLRSILFASLMAGSTLSFAQEAPENWFNLDQGNDNVAGVSTEKAYKELLKDRKSETVVVAVIDSGVDYKHEDLKEVMWVNKDEIPDNGIDDDKNGYIDDIHGWNFIGGKNGDNVNNETLEITRLVAHYKKKFDGKDRSSLSKKEKKEYDRYQKLKKEVEEKLASLEERSSGYTPLYKAMEAVIEKTGKSTEDITAEDLANFTSDDATQTEMVKRLGAIMASEGASFAVLHKELKGAFDYFNSQIHYNYNVDYDPRNVVGDDYSNPNDRDYGNADVQGPDAEHGTHVAGIIAAVRDNNLGMKGVANNVAIMSIRAVPNGDERDKDVANAIRYAVDNGASIINMSFGKGQSWDKKIVDEAVKYAAKHDVLLVHAAGNSHLNTDIDPNYPTPRYTKKFLFFKRKKTHKNWIEVGASSWKGGKDALASFSNYGKEGVDLFAPGHNIYATVPDQGYESLSGTSMASPVVAGIAALLRSYFPKLTAVQVKEILTSTTVPVTQQVKKPGYQDGDALVSMKSLCNTGGLANTYNAVKKAMLTKGKKK